MSVKLLTDPHLEFLSLRGGCTGSSESTLVKIPHCLKSHVAAHIIILLTEWESKCGISISKPIKASANDIVTFVYKSSPRLSNLLCLKR